jgi:hypothetical protein
MHEVTGAARRPPVSAPASRAAQPGASGPATIRVISSVGDPGRRGDPHVLAPLVVGVAVPGGPKDQELPVPARQLAAAQQGATEGRPTVEEAGVPDQRREDVQVPAVHGDRREQLVGPLVALGWRKRRNPDWSGGFGHAARLDGHLQSIPGRTVPASRPPSTASGLSSPEVGTSALRVRRPEAILD